MAASPVLPGGLALAPTRSTPHERCGGALAALLCLVSIWAPRPAEAQAAVRCEGWTAELTAVEGAVELQAAGSPNWGTAASGAHVCLGDTIRVPRSGRALLTLPDGSTLRLDANTTIVLSEPPRADGSLVEIVRGLIHVISRDPRQLRFSTPHINAGLEGTEFDIGVDEAEGSTRVAVLEGVVKVTSPSGEVLVARDQLGVGRTGEAPSTTPLPAPIELMRWTGHYRPLFDDPLPSPEQAPTASEERDPEFFARRAAALLGTARLEAARSDLAAAFALRKGHPAALAVEAMIALARGDVAAAKTAAIEAASSDPRSVAALLALSYAEQAEGNLAAAERAALAAMEARPDSALAATRRAELRLGAGDSATAIALATRARELDPRLSDPLVVIGFAELAAFATARAEAAFRDAAALAPQAPEPRLGLALAAARRGAVAESRRQLELAVANDPTDGLTRSYMAKVYEMERSGELTATQLDLAKTLSPHEATPWLYAALADLHRNQPVGALRGLRNATARNDDEAVFRSELILDDDLATRSAAVGRIYTTLGFGRLALLDAWRAVNASPSEYSGHRLLADAYATEPRHEIARVSELLVAELLQPANVTPIKPQLGQPGLNLAQRIGPSQLSFDEFTTPIAREGPKLNVSSIAGGNGTVGSELTVAGLNDRVSYSAGHYRVATDGFRANNDFTQEIGNAFVQFRPSDTTSVQAEIRAVRGEQGDLTTVFDQQAYSRTRRLDQDVDALRVGAQQRLSDLDSLLISIVRQDVRTQIRDPGFFALSAEREGYSTDVQYLRDSERHRLQAGLLYASQDERIESVFDPSLPPGTSDAELRQIGAYGYWHHEVAKQLTLTLGASLDRVEDETSDDAFNPKVGLLWRANERTTFRAAAFKTLFGSLTTSPQNPQPRLEPVQIAGFTQLITGGIADRSKVAGVGVDHAFTARLLVGAELIRRETDRPILIPTAGVGVERTRLDEQLRQAYVLFTPTDELALSARLERGHYTSDPVPSFSMLRTTIRRLPLEARYFFRNGFTLGARATHVRQDGLFEGPPLSPFDPPALTAGSDAFVVVDAFASYRLPNRRGLVSLNADNLLDEQFRFQDVDPTNPSLIPERLLSVRFTLAFD